MLKATNRFSLCLCVIASMCAGAMSLPAQSGSIPVIKDDPKAFEAMVTALKALGGEKIDNIKSLVFRGTGTSNIKINDIFTPDQRMGISTFEFETRIMLPNDCITIIRYPDRVAYTGVSQDKMLINYISPPYGDGAYDVLYTERERIECSNILVGLLMKTGPRPLSLSSTKKDGIFDLIVIGGGPPMGNARLRAGRISEFEFDAKTGYPSVLTYSELTTFGAGKTVYTFSTDRFAVNGIMFPRSFSTHHTKTMMGGGGPNVTEWRIDEVQINPKLTLKDFETSKKK